ncbi:hypothetical protein LTR96_011437 [Exophiala xenobiotica]|nr:hypothetical protein LTR41_011575 [Exophiala xenobiotica]KAK5215269.1 hypothetical protein LTR72_011666 [Exophiala xenobiotica]KAK5263135.1 hypothetical protein LTR96_011437 [Exophiala xenobiotica]KAK5284641.1 hypothetical protein LTR14_011609 [Exophiala xenobiotica]KAK5332415.1 hypothetical protein LTR98_011457 [Exophiala xenobiotica]
MAAFIAYQPRGNAPRFDNHTFSKSPTVGSSTCASSRQSSKSPDQTNSVGTGDFVDFVDLTASHQDTPRACLVLQELLEPMCRSPDNSDIRVARDRSSGATCSDKIEAGDEGDKDDDDVDCKSEASDLPSFHEILTQNNPAFGGGDEFGCKVFASPATVDRTGGERGREGDSEEVANLANLVPATVTSIQLGASRDHPIVLEDDPSVDTHHDGTSLDDERPTCQAVDPAYPGDECPKLSGGCAARTDDGKHGPDYSAKYNTDNRANHKQEEGNEPHNDDAVQARALAGDDGDNDCSGSGVDSDAPASVG